MINDFIMPYAVAARALFAEEQHKKDARDVRARGRNRIL